MNKEGDLRVWWIPQVPMNAFYVFVKDEIEARKILNVLAEYDKFQFENRVKGDYSNTGGLQVHNGGTSAKDEDNWDEWESPNGCSIDEYDEEADIARECSE